jgi:ubiquinone biosynthesis protein UbiJ
MIEQLLNNLLGVAEIGGNRLLSMDPSTLERCVEMQGQIIAIELIDLDKTLYIHPGSWGLRVSLQDPGREPDAIISGRVMALANLSLQDEKISTSIQEKIEIAGNTKVAQKFQTLMAEIDIDFEELLAGYIGDVAAFRINQGLQQARKWVESATESIATSGREYLQEESRQLPTYSEFERFSREVEEIRNGVERAEALLRHYQKSGDL